MDVQTNNCIDNNNDVDVDDRMHNNFGILLSGHVDNARTQSWACSVASKSCSFRPVTHTWYGLIKNKIRAVISLSHAHTATRIGTPRCGRHDRNSDKRRSSPFDISGAKPINDDENRYRFKPRTVCVRLLIVSGCDGAGPHCSQPYGKAILAVLLMFPRKGTTTLFEMNDNDGPIRSDPIRSNLKEW